MELYLQSFISLWCTNRHRTDFTNFIVYVTKSRTTMNWLGMSLCGFTFHCLALSFLELSSCTHGWNEKHRKNFVWTTVKGRDGFGDRGMGGEIILKSILYTQKWCVVSCSKRPDGLWGPLIPSSLSSRGAFSWLKRPSFVPIQNNRQN